jgi:hypothetical protein
VSDSRCTAAASSGGSNGTGDDIVTGGLEAERGYSQHTTRALVLSRVVLCLCPLSVCLGRRSCVAPVCLSVWQPDARCSGGLSRGAGAHTLPLLTLLSFLPPRCSLPFPALRCSVSLCASCLAAAAKDSNGNG